MLAYFGCMLVMGIVRLPSLKDYWKNHTIFNCTVINRRISRDKFLNIHRQLHFINNSSLPLPGSQNYDKIGKVRHVLNLIEERFLAVYNPHCECTIDEAMIPYKGRSSFKQFMPNKPVKRGMKVWMRADSHNGYVSEFQVYVGKTGDSEKGLGSRVVKDLTKKISKQYYHIYFDNFFSSPLLLVHLYEKGLYGCGTIRIHRKGFPDELKPYVKCGFSERGESMVLQSQQYTNLTACVWQDTKPVTVVATNSQSVPLRFVHRKQKNGDKKQYPCPESICLYNQYMGGVDINDQLRQYYHVRLKTTKNYKYLFWFIFDVAVTNAFILGRINGQFKTVKDFRLKLAEELLDGYCSRKRKGRKAKVVTKKFCSSHYPKYGDGKQHRCQHCIIEGMKKKTTWKCYDCDMYLCHNGKDDDCFFNYHKKYVVQETEKNEQ